MNTVHYPVFIDAEVNPAANLTYSERRLADIHGNTSGEPFEGSIFCLGDWKLMTDKLREVFFFSLMSKSSILSLGLCAMDKRFFIGLDKLNW